MDTHLILLSLATATLIAMLTLFYIQKLNHRPKHSLAFSKGNAKNINWWSDDKIVNYINLAAIEQNNNNNVSETELLLKNLKLHPKKYAVDCFKVFINIPLQNFNERWNFVYAISKLNIPELIPTLENIANSEIQKTEAINSSVYQKNGDEITIRLRAIHGLKSIAIMGSSEAENGLFELLKNNCFSINMAAVEGLLEINKTNINRIKLLLSKDKQMLVETAQSNRFTNYCNNELVHDKIDFRNSNLLKSKYN